MFKFYKQSAALKAGHFCLAVMLWLPMLLTSAQAEDTQSLPEEPIESSWDSLPLDPNLTVQPVLKSREGDIIIRGRKVGDHNMVNLSSTECKQHHGKAIVVTAVGVMPDDICKNVSPVKQGSIAVSTYQGNGDNYGALYGRHTGWVIVEFQQEIDGNTFYSGIPEYDPKQEDAWGITVTGALVRFEKGHRVVYAPGEEIQFDKVHKYIVKAVMTEQDLRELQAESVFSGLDKLSKDMEDMDKKEKNHKLWAKVVAGLIIFGIPLAVIYGLYRLVRRLLARRRAKQGGNIEEPK